MEKKEAVIKEDIINSTFSDQIPIPMSSSFSFCLSNNVNNMFDMEPVPCDQLGEKGSTTMSSLGFMDMLGIHEDYNPSLFDFLQTPLIPIIPSPLPDSSEVLNTPPTPNSCSISSSSTEAPNDHEQTKTLLLEEEEQDPAEKTKKQ